jgi:hypothetical protein
MEEPVGREGGIMLVQTGAKRNPHKGTSLAHIEPKRMAV